MSERWHTELQRTRAVRTLCAGIDPRQARWASLSGVTSRLEERGNHTWELRELLSFDDLFEEGSRMHHCVATYVRACLAGTASIWSLRISRACVETERVTVRVDVGSRKVVEARAFANAAISVDQHRWIRDWATTLGLRGVEGVLCR